MGRSKWPHLRGNLSRVENLPYRLFHHAVHLAPLFSRYQLLLLVVNYGCVKSQETCQIATGPTLKNLSARWCVCWWPCVWCFYCAGFQYTSITTFGTWGLIKYIYYQRKCRWFLPGYPTPTVPSTTAFMSYLTANFARSFSLPWSVTLRSRPGHYHRNQSRLLSEGGNFNWNRIIVNTWRFLLLSNPVDSISPKPRGASVIIRTMW